MHVAVLGAGGLGCILGARVAHAGADVTLIGRSRHVRAIRDRGLIVSGIHGEYVQRDRLTAVTEPGDVTEPVDLLIVAVKCRDTEAALASADDLRGRVSMAMSVQNSVEKDGWLSAWLGPQAVLGASTTEAATLVGDGRVRHLGSAPRSLYIGELDGPSSDRAEAVAALFTRAGVGAETTNDIAHVEWEKLLQISIVSGFSASAIGFHPTATFTDGISVDAGARHYVAIARELLAIYRALGYEPRDFFAPYSRFVSLRDAPAEQSVVDTLDLAGEMRTAGVFGRPSLHEDLRNGRPTEVDDSIGVFLAAADRLGLDAPTATGCLRTIRMLEAFATIDPGGHA